MVKQGDKIPGDTAHMGQASCESVSLALALGQGQALSLCMKTVRMEMVWQKRYARKWPF